MIGSDRRILGCDFLRLLPIKYCSRLMFEKSRAKSILTPFTAAGNLLAIQLKIKGGDPMSSDMCMVSADFGVKVQFGTNGRKEK